MDEKTIARFWSHVDKSGGPNACWPWTGSRNDRGYGWFGYYAGNGKSRAWKAHRVAFRIAHGRWPEPNACHHCDSPPCCNDAHLFEGDSLDNARDRCRKSRGGGLNDEQLWMILARPWQRTRAVARRMGLHDQTVFKVRKRYTERVFSPVG